MLASNDRDHSTLYELPGRTWSLLLGPENSPAANMTMGYAVWPPGSTPPPHTHVTQEEIIYILKGTGTLYSADGEVTLAPGTAAYIEPGTEHWISSGPGETLEFVTIFSPPGNPGASMASNAPAIADVAGG